ncbi:hypothetical protein FRC09_019822 [Ceratobasidium sp. 395]|nr:hypothetical protein FRC09_019822 [Ceratobasidium sp. 395]
MSTYRIFNVAGICLNNLVLSLLDLGHPEDALSAALEATELRRKLVTDDPATYTSDLAILEEAINTLIEAVSLRREFVADKPAVDRLGLAIGLITVAATEAGAQQRGISAA